MDFALSFLALLFVAAFFIVRFRLNASVAPFAVAAGITVFLCLFGMLNLLFPATLAVFAFAAFSAVYLVWFRRREWRDTVRQVFTPGFVFFVAVSVAFFFAVRAKNPYFTFWDEFSFWGIAAKNLFTHRQLYTLFTSSMINISYPPALPVWSFFMQVFNAGFSEWRVYAAYDILMAAVMAVLFARLKWKNYIAVPVLSFTAVSCTYLFWYSFEGLKLYMTSYSDVPLGVLFGGAVLAYFATSEERTLPNYIAVAVCLMLLPLVKDVGLAFGLVAAVICSFDMLVSGHWPARRVFGTEKWYGKLVFVAGLFAALLFSYAAWSLHLGAAADIERNAVPYEYSIFQMLGGKDPYFNEMFRRMAAALRERQLVTFGTVQEMVIAFTAAPIVVALLCREKRNILRVGAAAVELCAGFFLYYLFQTYAYTAIFTHSSEYNLTSFERYISSYAIGWMFAVIGLCYFAISRWRFSWGDTVPGIVVSGLLIGALFHFTPVNFDQYVFTSDKIYQVLIPLREHMMTNAAVFQDVLTSDDHIYYVCQDSDGGEWFYFNYEFQPAYVEQTLGGGNFVAVGSEHSGGYDVEVDTARFTEFLREKEIDYVFVEKVDEYFIEEFSPMFEDFLMGFHDGSAHMYKVVDNGSGILLVPVYNATHFEILREQYGY